MGVGNQNPEKQIGKQVGCMTGFLNIFDRHQLFAGKRISSAKRLPPPPPPETRGASAVESKTQTENEPPKTTLRPLPVLEFKEGTGKFSKEAPRLSLDSRAVVDARGSFHPREVDVEVEVEKQRRSTSVVARLMGLDDSDPELRRSVSESRVIREDLNPPHQQYRFFDTTNFQLKQVHHHAGKKSSDPNARGMRQKKNFYDSADFFPGPKQSVSVVHGEIERRLKMRGIDEPSKDLDALKQILEALQLKGLLHSKNSTLPLNLRNFVYDGSDYPIVVMKPGRSSGSFQRTRFTGNNSPPASTFRSNPQARSEPGRNARGRNPSSPTRSPNRMRKGTTAETQRKLNDGVDRTRASPVHSTPVKNSRVNGPDRQGNCRSPRMRKANSYQKEEKVAVATADDELSTVSDSSFSTSSYTDTERLKVEDPYREGKNLLRRCDKLLNSIAEITTELQPSPVSVLDSSSVYRDELSPCSSPSPVTKRCIDYRDQAAESEDDLWIAPLCYRSDAKPEDRDFNYVSEILRASNCLPEDSDVFLLLEKQQNDTSIASMLQRRLIFDAVHEILNRSHRLPPWMTESSPLLRRIWSEFVKIREREESSTEDMFEVICGLLRKDMAGAGGSAGVNEWGECPVEMGEMVLDIERFIFKDLIGETIHDLASIKGHRNRVSALRRKLVF